MSSRLTGPFKPSAMIPLVLFALALVGCGQVEVGVDGQAVDKAQREIDWKGELAALAPEDVERFRGQSIKLYEEGDYKTAKAKMIRAYAAFQRFGDDGRSQRVDYLRFLAKLSNLLDENEGTIKHATDFAVYASEEKDKSLAYGLLAQAYSNKNQFDKASRYFQAALKIQLTTLGPEHPDLAVTYSNIGMACDFQGEHDKAIGYHQKSLAVRRDPNHLVVAPTYNKIGRNYADCGETAKAIAYLQRAEAIYLKQLGVDHPLTKSAQISLDRLND